MSPEIPARFDRMWVEAQVELDDGSILHTQCKGPKGVWGSPPISDAEHLVKIRDCLSRRLPQARAETLIDLAHRVETLEPAWVRELIRLAA
jgi:hypothetical protein